jgi:membrane protease YdiL (CAAX protease family)
MSELVTGFAIGAALFVSLALARAWSVGATWTFAGLDASTSALAGLAVALLLLLPEELVFRGYAFRRLSDALGTGPAIAISAVLFGLYHVAGSGMWGVGALFQFAMPALGGTVFGWAAVRSGGLALPIGLHLGGNWAQASVLSFAAPSGSGPRALWTAQLSDVQQQYLLAPDLAPHLPYIITMCAGMLILRATLHRREPTV